MEFYRERYKILKENFLEDSYRRLSTYLINNKRIEDTKLLDKLFINLLSIEDNGKAFSFMKKFLRELIKEDFKTLYDIVYSYTCYLYNDDTLEYSLKDGIFYIDQDYIHFDYDLCSFIISLLNNSRYCRITEGGRKHDLSKIESKLNFLGKDNYYKELIRQEISKATSNGFREDAHLFNINKLAYMYLLDEEEFDRNVDFKLDSHIALYYRGYSLDEIPTISSKLIEILKDRKYLLPASGVELYDIDYIGPIKSIKIKEKFIGDDLYLMIYYKIFGSFYPLYINLTKGYALYVNDNINSVLPILFDFYDINPIELNKENKPFIAYPLVTINYNGSGLVARSFMEPAELKPIYKIREMGQWNQKERIYEYHKEGITSTSGKIQKTIELAAYKRKLAMGQHVSSEALAYAEKHCLTLREGETIVREHTKKVKVNIQ